VKTAKITLDTKDPDGWHEVIETLGLSAKVERKYFEFGEYATVELEIDENLQVVGGRLIPTR